MLAEIAINVFACVCLADFVTGVIHWWEDTYGNPDWPLLGELIVKPNIEHHRRQSMADGTFWSRCELSIAAAVTLLCWAAILDLCYWQVVLTLSVGAVANEVHSWNHGNKNRLGMFLQDLGVAQTPAHHRKHHKAPYATYFCPITNWVNPVLDFLRFWQVMEWLLSRCGIHPLRGSDVRAGV